MKADRIGATGRDLRRVLLVTGIVTPYTNRIFEAIARRHGIDLHVRACAPSEPDRHWKLNDAQSYDRRVLRGLRWHRSYVSHIYVNPGIILDVLRLRPDVVLVGDFSPTMLLAAATARAIGIPVALASNGVPISDPGATSLLHRLARRAMAPLVSAAVVGSTATLEVLARYGIAVGRGVVRPVIPGWDYNGPVPGQQERPYDLLFCGLIDDRWKGALHFLDTVKLLHARERSLRVRVVGDGPLREQLRDGLAELGVEARFDGYVQQSELADVYMSSKLLFFSSRGDAWGIVANEAAQCGTPVMISTNAQAAYGLVQRFGCGEVMPLEPGLWADNIERYLDDEELWNRASKGGLASREHFSVATAADLYVRGMKLARDGRTADAVQAKLADRRVEP